MTIDVELLPMPSVLLNWPHPTNHVAIRDYARACVAHATAAKDTKIEALRVEVAAQRARADAMAGEAIKHEARAERLAEALREAQPFIGWAGSYEELHTKIDALLRDQEEGRGNDHATQPPSAPEANT